MLKRLWKQYAIWIDLGLLTTLAMGLRVWGIGFDLPNLYHPDEYVYVTIALKILKTGSYNPHFFNYPTLFFYILAFLGYIPYFLAYASRGLVSNLDGLTLPVEVIPRDVTITSMPSEFLAGRLLTAVFAVGTVVLVYWIGRKLFSRQVGFIAGLLLAVSPTHVRISHFITPDVMMTFFVTLAVLLAYQVMVSGRQRDYLLAGAAVGLAATTKYNAGAAIVLLLAAHLLHEGRQKLVDRNLVTGVLTCGVVFLIGSPYMLLDLPTFLNDLAFEMRHYALLTELGQVGSSWFWYVQYMARTEGLVSLLAVIAIAYAFLKRTRKGLFVASFSVVYFLWVSSYTVRNDRTLAPILPLISLLTATLIHNVLQALSQRVPQLRDRWASATLATVVIAAVTSVPFSASITLDRALTRPDVRTTAAAWAEQDLPPGSRIVAESYSPAAATSVHHLEYVRYATEHPLDWYRQNADYLFLYSRGHYATLVRDPQGQATMLAHYQAIFDQFELVRQFDGPSLGYNYWVRIYRVK